ncbi:MAG: GNAT family N-acetyltransferase [Clostridiales bacterium]|nr:GNAT family N-acetyltransferase [Clostridiales bacterium]
MKSENNTNQDIIIREVTDRVSLRKFADYPNELYKDVPEYIPNFYQDDLDDWTPGKNPAFEYCEAKAFLAYRDGKIVGRIGAILNHRANAKWNTSRMRFSQVDFIDDYDVSRSLFAAVEDWARQKGCTQVHGPLGFCDLDREGMLVDGFDQRSLFFTYYNHPYYQKHLSTLGYDKDVDWVEYRIDVPTKDSDYYNKIHRLSQIVIKRQNLHVVNLRRRSDYKPYVKKVFQLINEAYEPLYGVVELNDEQVQKYADKFIPLVNPDYCCFVVDDKDDLVAFGVSAPSMADALKKSRGRLLPLGWIRILRSLQKPEALDLLLMAVKPVYQKQGLNSILIDHVHTNCIKNGIKYVETGPELELNRKMTNQWKMLGVEPFKRRSCFIKDI